MNMKKTIAGVIASVVAISAMATTMVSAKNDLTFTSEQKSFSKTWDLTATKYKVTWEGKTNYSYKIPTAAVTTPASDKFVITTANGSKITVTVSGLTAAFTVANGAADAANAAYAGSTLTLNVLDAGTTTAADLATAINTLSGFKAEVAYAVGATVAGTVVADADVVAGTSTHTAAVTTGTATGNDIALPGSGDAAALLVEFFETEDSVKDGSSDSSSVSVDSATLKIDGFKYLNTVDTAGNKNTTPVSKTYDLRKIKDTNKWYICNVAKGSNTSLGMIDIATTFDAYITNYELSYTTSDSKTTKKDADDLANTEKKYYADIWQEGVDTAKGEPTGASVTTPNYSWDQVFTSFDKVSGNKAHSLKGSGNVIVTPKGKTGSVETVHGVTFTGLNASTLKDTAGNYHGIVSKQDTIYYLGNPNAADQRERNDFNIVAWDGKSSYIHSFKEEVTSQYSWAKEGDAKDEIAGLKTNYEGAKRNDDIKNVAWNSMLKNIQSLIGDAKGATISFGVYTATTTDAGRGNDTFDRDTDAPLVSGATAQDFALAVNTQSSNKFYSAANMKDNKITLSWDEITNGLAAGTIIDGAIRISAGKKFVIDSVTVDVPAKTLAELSAGEAAEETTVALETTKAADAAETTAAAANPTTGNAPIALAVIPVAIIAAAVVAKKRG